MIKIRLWIRQKYIDYVGTKFLPLRRELSTYPPAAEYDPYAIKRFNVNQKLIKLQRKYNNLIDKQMADRQSLGKKEIRPGVYWE
jgi:hypothetical protein